MKPRQLNPRELGRPVPVRSIPRAEGTRSHPARAAFSLIELLITISIIGIMVSMVIASFTNAAQDARAVLARQQQAVLQEALNNWASKQMSGQGSVAGTRGAYAAAATGAAKLALVSPYLDEATYQHFVGNTTNANQVRSEAMAKNGEYVTFSAWGTNTYPKVELQ